MLATPDGQMEAMLDDDCPLLSMQDQSEVFVKGNSTQVRVSLLRVSLLRVSLILHTITSTSSSFAHGCAEIVDANFAEKSDHLA